MIIDVAIGFSVILFLVFFFIQTSLVFQDYETLNNMTREVARGLASGDSISGAKARAYNWDVGTIPHPDTNIQFTLDHSSDGTSWTDIADTTPVAGGNTSNNAAPGELVRVRTSYNPTNFPHFYTVTPTFRAAAIMRRE